MVAQGQERTVLLADDSAAIRIRVREVLESRGLRVIEAADGVDCIKQVFREWPSFIVLDVRMPKMSGYQACRFLKNHPRTRAIPVMLLTAMDQPVDELWGYQTGADFFRTKSSDLDALADGIARAVSVHAGTTDSVPEEMTETDILTSLNEFLDSRLFELTLVKEIAAVSNMMNDMGLVIDQCGMFLDRLVASYRVAFTLTIDNRTTVFLWSRYQRDTDADAFRDHVVSTLKAAGHDGIEVVSRFGEEEPPATVAAKRELVRLQPPQGGARRTDGPVKGDIFVSINRDHVESLKRVGFIYDHLQLVLDNGMLYRRVVMLSTTDELTQASNRRRIIEELRIEMERTERYGLGLSIIMIDIDHFKQINDTFGHKAGDRVLQKLVQVVKATLRKVDSLGRMGGEEFLVVLPQTSLDNALVLAERIRTMLRATVFEDVTGSVTVSMGVCTSRGGSDIDGFIQRADMALYEAKRGGRDRVCTCIGGTP